MNKNTFKFVGVFPIGGADPKILFISSTTEMRRLCLSLLPVPGHDIKANEVVEVENRRKLLKDELRVHLPATGTWNTVLQKSAKLVPVSQ